MENLSPKLTITKSGNKAKTMSSVDALHPDLAEKYARKMVERESRGNGDQMNALERVGRRCGMTARSLRRLLNGETRDPGIAVFGRIRAAYLDLCARQIAELQHEIEIEKARIGDASFEDLDREVEVLAEKVRQAKGR
jgi:transcriptional regulator with XRE-family HTH domain